MRKFELLPPQPASPVSARYHVNVFATYSFDLVSNSN